MKKHFNANYLLVLLAVFIAACEKSPYPGYEMADNGVYAKFYTQSIDSPKVQQGDVLTLVMSYRTANDSVIFDSKVNNPYGKMSIDFPVSEPPFKGSFEHALMMMSEGDSASFLINADSLYLKAFKYNELPDYIESGSMLTFEAKVVKITTKAQFEEEQRRAKEEQMVMLEHRKNEEPKILVKYLLENKITVTPTESGLYYIETKKGKGKTPAGGSRVKVDYIARLMDGNVFDTSIESVAMESGAYDARRLPYQPFEFILGDMSEVPPGFSEGISLMREGGKAQLIIPSSLGFGGTLNISVPPYSTLLFEVELISITPPANS